jgi:rhamnogalacturonyl hydrolase YesR
MIASLQVNAYRNYVDSIRYLNNATRTLVRYIDSIQQPGGLFYHAPCMGAHYYWGRGNGWAASAMTEALLAMPLTHPARAHIMTAYLRQMSALIKYQDQVGLWHQLVTDTTTYKETSCTGMFVYALATGVKQGWLVGDTFKLAAKRGWMALAPCLDTINGLRYVCTGFGATSDSLAYRTHAQATGDAHGTAGYIWAATAMVRMLTPSTHTIDSKIPQRTLVQKNSRTDNRIFDLSGRYAGQASANGIDNAQNRASMSHGCFISNGKKVLKLEK